MSNDEFRIEYDTLGSVLVPCCAPYGAQTQRSKGIFQAYDGVRLASYPTLIEAILRVKDAAARTNSAIGALDVRAGRAISEAVELALGLPAETAFPIHSFHGGGGVGLNMNANEVLANLANKRSFGSDFGSYTPLHPNDHVNLNHATSDCLSTATHIAVRNAWRALEEQLKALLAALESQTAQLGDQPKLARTCLQDAVDIRAADYFGGVAHNLRALTLRATQDADALAHVNLGGNVIGREDDCDPHFFAEVMPHLNEVLTEANLVGDLTRDSNLFAASQAHDKLQSFAASIEQIARAIIKFAGDLRLMASGPEAGFGEIRLPVVQPGSSAIPGKINPSVPEFAIQCAMMVCGRAATIRMTADHGELDYNPWQMLVGIALLDMISLIESGIRELTRSCVTDLELDPARNTANAQSLGPSLVQLKRQSSYSHAAAVAKKAAGDVSVVRAELLKIRD